MNQAIKKKRDELVSEFNSMSTDKGHVARLSFDAASALYEPMIKRSDKHIEMLNSYLQHLYDSWKSMGISEEIETMKELNKLLVSNKKWSKGEN